MTRKRGIGARWVRKREVRKRERAGGAIAMGGAVRSSRAAEPEAALAPAAATASPGNAQSEAPSRRDAALESLVAIVGITLIGVVAAAVSAVPA